MALGDSARGKVLIFQKQKKKTNLRITNTKSILPRRVDRSARSIDRSSRREGFDTRRRRDRSPLHRRDKQKKSKSTGLNDESVRYSRAIDPLEERSRRRSADSRADDRRAGRYSRHTFELQCKRTSVEPYTYSMLLYLKWWKWWQLNVVSVHFYKGRGCISKDKKKRNTLDAADKNKGATYS